MPKANLKFRELSYLRSHMLKWGVFMTNCNCNDELPLITATIAIILAKNMSTEELNFFGNFLTAIAAEMLTIAAARVTFIIEETEEIFNN